MRSNRHGLCLLGSRTFDEAKENDMNPAISRKRRAQSYASHHDGGSHEHSEGRHHGSCPVNVGHSERQFSMIGGGVLAAYGLMKGSFTGLALAALGGALVWRGYTGHCQMYEMLGHSTTENEQSSNQGHSANQGHRANQGHSREASRALS
jgi:hypothetical protein